MADPAPGRPLRDLVGEGLPNATVSFLSGSDRERHVASERLRDDGAAWFGAEGAPAVATILTNDRPSVSLVLGAVEAGARLVSLPMPARGGDLGAYVDHLRACLDREGVHEIVAADAVADLLDTTGIPTRRHSALTGRPAPVAAAAGAFSLVQFSSGSTGDPKGILVGERELAANLVAIAARTAPGPGDSSVSWLPLSHDMGLIGLLLTTLVSGGERYTGDVHLGLLDPRDFLRDPRCWTTAIAEHRATFSAVPDFGLRLVARRGVAAGADLSSLRCMIVGGEIVRPDSLTAFAAATACPDTAICPSYGMAEVGLAISIDQPGRPWATTTVSATGAASLDLRDPDHDADRLDAVRCGAPLDGYRVDTGGGIGRIVVDGPSIGRDAATGISLGEPSLRTGDLGWRCDDDVVVLGRDDDLVVVHGRRVHAPFVEARLGEVAGVRAGRCAVAVLPSGEFVAAVEPEPGEPRHLDDHVRRAVVGAAGASPDRVVVLERGALPMTPSGKLRRRGLNPLLLPASDTRRTSSGT